MSCWSEMTIAAIWPRINPLVHRLVGTKIPNILAVCWISPCREPWEMSNSENPATKNIETMRRENKIAVRKIREFIERLKEIQEYERSINDEMPNESKTVSATTKR